MKLFSITNNNETCYKTIKFCCFQIKFRSKKLLKKRIKSIETEIQHLEKTKQELLKEINDKNELMDFFQSNVEPRTILFIEPNACHGEVLPGMYKYFSDLGYQVDVIMERKEAESYPFSKIKDSNLRIFSMHLDNILTILKSGFIKQYDYIYLNTNKIYAKNSITFPSLQKDFLVGSEKILQMIHDTKYLSEYDKHKTNLLMLAKLPMTIDDVAIINTHYFGEIQFNKKNKIINFITIGNVDSNCKNFNLLTNTIEQIINKGINNFKVTIVSRTGYLDNISEKIINYVDFKGRLSYPDLYNEMEKADFFLPLLDPECEAHNRYVTTGTSGSFQLIYGFLKPCIINSKFASIPGFDNQNSIIYDKNEELADKMIEAINMSEENYNEMRNKLKELANNIYQESLDNLRKIIEK